jgi:hypothetical protein
MRETADVERKVFSLNDALNPGNGMNFRASV